MRLINAELKRFWSRRLVWITAVSLLAFLTFPLLQAYEDARPANQEEQARSEQFYQKDVQHWDEIGRANKAACYAKYDALQLVSDERVSYNGCDNLREPVLADFSKRVFSFDEGSVSALTSAALMFIFAGLLIGASFIAAEIKTGALGNWLTFEPRRTRVFFSKVVAVALGVGSLALACLLFFESALFLIYGANGSLGAMTGVMWMTILWTALRIMALTMMGAVGGLTLGLITKHTAAALCVASGYMIVVDTLILGESPSVPGSVQGWLVSSHLSAFADNGMTYSYSGCEKESGMQEVCAIVEKHISLGDATVYLLGLLAVFVLVAWLVFRRRDVN